MHCPRCGSPLDANASLCGVCGTPTGSIPMSRPTVVTVLAILQFVGGTLALLMGLAGIATGALSGTIPALGAGVAALFVGFGVLQLACGIGLWTVKPWGYTLQILLAVIGLIGFPIGTILSVCILWLFLRPGAKVLFSGRPANQLSAQEAAEVAAFGSSPLARAIVVLVVLIATVVPLVGILAAIAIPGLMRARTAGNEASAIGSIRTVNSAQATFAATCGNGYYAPDLASLSIPAEPGGVAFVSPDLSMDPTVKSGYTITLVGGQAVEGAPVACNGTRVVGTYFVSAEPTDPGTTGQRFFAANQEGTVYESTSEIPVTHDGAPGGATPLR